MRYQVVGDDGRAQGKYGRKVDAELKLAELVADQARGTWVDPRDARRPFRALVKEWQAAQVHADTTRARVESNVRNHVLPFLGDRPVGSIRTSELQAWVRSRSQVLAPSTVEPLFRYVSAVFAAAVVDRALLSNPCAGVTLPRVKRAPVEPLRVELVHALVAALPPRYRALGALVAGAGLRPGEAFAVEVDRHVDFLRRSVRVEQQLKLLPGGPPFLAPPKTQASYRTVPLPQYVLDALAAHLAEFPAEPVEVEDRTGPKPRRRLARLVFTNGDGEPIRRTGFSAKAWRPAVARVRKAAGAARGEGRPAEALTVPAGVRLHDFRHLYASLLIFGGESVKVVQARLGHASARETLETYGHLWPDTEDRTRQAVDAILGARPDSQTVTRPSSGRS